MIPTKHQFQELTKACESDRLTASLNLLFGNETESRICAFIEGFDRTLNTAFLNYILLLPAYQWLSEQQPFDMAQRKALPEAEKTWCDDQIRWVIQQIDENLKQGIVRLRKKKPCLKSQCGKLPTKCNCGLIGLA